MGIIDDGKLQNILPKYSELKLSGKNLAQQYVSAFNTGMNIYQCVNQLQGYIEWVVKAVNDVVVQWNDIVDKQIKYAVNETITVCKQTTTEQFNIEWVNLQPKLDARVENLVDTRFDMRSSASDYYILTESKDKLIKKLDYYFKLNFDYLPDSPYYGNSIFITGLDLEGYTVKRSFLTNNTCKLKNKSTGELIDYVYLLLDNLTVTTNKDDPEWMYTNIEAKYFHYFAKLKTDTPVGGQLDVDICISIILEKTST